jgi:hypothetical protein
MLRNNVVIPDGRKAADWESGSARGGQHGAGTFVNNFLSQSNSGFDGVGLPASESSSPPSQRL